jgi:hypothetical protein
MKQIIAGVAIMGALLFSNTVEAKHRHHNINKAQQNQRERIQQGVRNGSITKMEARKLHMQQAKIRHYKQMAKADGRVTNRERKLIHREQMVANRSIYHQKHDGQRRNRGEYNQGYNNYRGQRRG